MSTSTTGATSPLAATATEPEPSESAAKKQKTSDERVSFVIPTGDTFEISRAAILCEFFKDGLLRRLVESELPTERDANGAIKLGVQCSRDAFQRVVDEYECGLKVYTRNSFIGRLDLATCGPALRVPINPCELRALYEYLGLPTDKLLRFNRDYPGTPIALRASQRVLDKAWEIAPQLECFFSALESTIGAAGLLHLPTNTMASRIQIALVVAWPGFDDAFPPQGGGVRPHFTNDLCYVLQDEEGLAELVRVFLPDQAHRFTGLKMRRLENVSELEKLPSFRLRLDTPLSSNLTVASRPVGWFAVAMPAFKLFDDKQIHF